MHRYFFILLLILLYPITGCNIIGPGKAEKEAAEMKQQQRAEFEKKQELEEKKIEEELKKLHIDRKMKYTIGSGDRFDLAVYNNVDLNMKQVIVKPDGTATINLIGEVHIAGLTVAEATRLIEEKFKIYIKYPKVTLNVFELLADSFTIVGQVGSPGIYSFDRTISLSDAIAMARGFTIGEFHGKSIELASLTTSYLVRNHKKLPVNFLKAIREGNKLHDIPLQDGDYIYIASVANQEIFILGEVRSPVYLGYQDGLTLARAIVYAKGRLETASETVMIIRQGKKVPDVVQVDLDSILRGEVNDFLLLPNDLIYVQRSQAEEWNRILRKIQPTLDIIESLLGIKDQVFPINGQLKPIDGWWEMDTSDTINLNVE